MASEPPQTPSLGDRLWNFLASVKLAFSLLLILASTSILGTLIQQNADPAMYQQEYGQAGTRLILALGLNNMYHARWFWLLMAGLALNLIICSLNRLPTTLGLMAKDPQADLKRSGQPEHSFTLAGAPASHRERASALLAKAVGPVTSGQVKDSQVLLAQKGAWSRLGVYVVHLSVIIIMSGAIVGGIWGYAGHLELSQGESAASITLDNGQERALGFEVRLDKFAVSFYKDGEMPSEYRSDVTILDQGKPALQAVLRVNQPADYQGVDFYQASYGQTVSRLSVNYVQGGQKQKVELEHGRWTKLADGSQALLLDARPEINMGEAYSGPAARIGYQQPGAEPLALMALKAGAPFPSRGPVSFEILDLQTVAYSGLSVKHDPGVWLIWLGCSLMVMGFIVTFYGAHRKVWVRLSPAGSGRTKVELLGSTNKNRPGLKLLLQRLAGALQANSGQGEQ